MGDAAFVYCTNLTSVAIPSSVTNIGFLAFESCSSLSAIDVDASNLLYSSVAGVLFDRSQSTLIEYPAGKVGSYTIPEGVTSIGESAFQYCYGLILVTIPDSVTSIMDGAFWSCTSLTNVVVGSSVTNIEDFAFESCLSLIGVYFKGNAPSASFLVFDHGYYTNYNNIVYYLPGTTGWSAAFAGIPTALWLPLEIGRASCRERV